jgi:hypothetical protein
VALEWEKYFGIAPSITGAISELDAALLLGKPEDEYCADGQSRSAVTRDVDFRHNGTAYQVTANRPSGKKGSFVTLVSKKSEEKRPFRWDRLIWILYDREYNMLEAWEFTADDYRNKFSGLKRLSPEDMREGTRLFPN